MGMTQADPTTDRLLVGNCLDTLKTLADDSIDSIVTDPPYELGFMGKAWDASGIAYQVDLWRECLRVLKPGGHLLAFGGTRTYHRMAVAIEDAGFEIRDSIHWTYGSGFPKSHNISKAIDKAAGAKREVVGANKNVIRASKEAGGSDYGGFSKADASITAPATKAAKKWNGWGTALKPSHEPIVVARKPINQTVAENVLQYGTGGINIDATRIGTTVETWPASRSYAAGQKQPGHQGETQATGDAPDGRFPANTLLTHNHDCDTTCTTNCPIELLDQQSGLLTPGHWTKTTTTGFGEFGGGKSEYHGPGEKAEKGGASRFFHNSQWSVADDLTPFIYQAKPGKKERNAGLDDSNTHPTVKPVELIRYLIKMVTPPKGTVLDPFLGSGTTAVAAILEGVEWKGCELTEDYLPIIEGRTAWATKEAKKKAKQPKQETLL